MLLGLFIGFLFGIVAVVVLEVVSCYSAAYYQPSEKEIQEELEKIRKDKKYWK